MDCVFVFYALICFELKFFFQKEKEKEKRNMCWGLGEDRCIIEYWHSPISDIINIIMIIFAFIVVYAFVIKATVALAYARRFHEIGLLHKKVNHHKNTS